MSEEQIQDLQIVRFNLIDYLSYIQDGLHKKFIQQQIQAINYIIGDINE
jgi:hypothetical protein